MSQHRWEVTNLPVCQWNGGASVSTDYHFAGNELACGVQPNADDLQPGQKGQ